MTFETISETILPSERYTLANGPLGQRRLESIADGWNDGNGPETYVEIYGVAGEVAGSAAKSRFTNNQKGNPIKLGT